MKVRRGFLLALLPALITATYYPVIFAEVCKVDDQKMLNSISNIHDVTFRALFLPGGANGWYYRPLIGASFLADRYLHGLNPHLMHLVNILLQSLNALLVYGIALLLIPSEKRRASPAPLIAAIFFGLHPLATESVSWLSGRTDLLAGFFLLSATLLTLKYRENGNRLFPVGALAALVCALLAKETAAAFFPGLLLLLICAGPKEDGISKKDTLRLSLFTRSMICVGAIAIGVKAVMVVRSLAFQSSANNISWTIKFMMNDLSHTIFVCLGAVGFYLKKMLIPWPLNFAIVEVDPLYELLGVLIVGLTFVALFRNTRRSALWIAGILLLTPSFLIAFNQIAWTPYAERYAYLPLALMSPACVSWLAERIHKTTYHSDIVATLLVVLVLGGTVFVRSVTWSTNLALIRNTVEVSPLATDIKGLYVLELVEHKRYYEAERYARELQKITSVGYDPRPAAIMAYLQMKHGNIVEAMTQLKSLTSRKSEYSPFVTTLLVDVIEEAAPRRDFPVTTLFKPEELSRFGDLLFISSGNYFIYYRLGKIFNRLGLPDYARDMFTKASQAAAPTDPLQPIIRRCIVSCDRLDTSFQTVHNGHNIKTMR